MSKTTLSSRDELLEYDRFHREGVLRTMASPYVHYDRKCPHDGCDQNMEWIWDIGIFWLRIGQGR